ncbi:MAG: hypothetical protein ACKOOD_01345 [Microbacteriaceae bacterium]
MFPTNFVYVTAVFFGLLFVLPQALGILSINKKLSNPRVETGSQLGLRSYRAFLITWLVPNVPLLAVLVAYSFDANAGFGLLSFGIVFLYIAPVAWIVMAVFLINGMVYRSVKNRDRDYSTPQPAAEAEQQTSTAL